MVIVYESKTGYTKKYAEMLAAKTGLRIFPTGELSQVGPGEEIIFLGWVKAGKIQGLGKARKHSIAAVCASGTGREAEPDAKTMMTQNAIGDKPFFYLRGGCVPLAEQKGMDKLMLSMFVKMLKNRKGKDERMEEAVSIIEKGFDGVEEKNLLPVLEWVNTRV